MNYFVVEPSVAGELGPGTIMDASTHPPMVKALEYSFSGWLGDAIVESFPCFIATDELAEAITKSDLTGYALDTVKVTIAETADDTLIENMPNWKWLKVSGTAKVDDIGMSEDYKLVLSDKALGIFKKYPLNDTTIRELN